MDNRWTRGAPLADAPVRATVEKVELPKLEGLAALASMPFTGKETRKKTSLALCQARKWLKIKNDPAKHAAKKERMKRFQLKNKEILNERKRKWYAENKERLQALAREKRKENKERRTATTRAWYAANKEHINAARRARRSRINSKGNTNEVAPAPLPVCL